MNIRVQGHSGDKFPLKMVILLSFAVKLVLLGVSFTVPFPGAACVECGLL